MILKEHILNEKKFDGVSALISIANKLPNFYYAILDEDAEPISEEDKLSFDDAVKKALDAYKKISKDKKYKDQDLSVEVVPLYDGFLDESNAIFYNPRIKKWEGN